MNFQISEHFNLIEFVCPCCGAAKLSSSFLSKLEDLRRTRGQIVISRGGGYRCPAYQKAIHYARAEILRRTPMQPKIAAHVLGQAVDVKVFDRMNGDLIPFSTSDIPALQRMGFTGIGIAKDGRWAHLDDAHERNETWEYGY